MLRLPARLTLASLAGALLPAGCAATTPKPPTATTTLATQPPHAGATPASPRVSLPVEPSPAVRARLTLSPHDATEADAWIDVGVTGHDEHAVWLCQTLLQQRAHLLDSSRLHAVVARACDTAPLPALEVSRSEHLLTDTEHVEDGVVMLMGAVAGREFAEPAPSAQLRWVSRFADTSRCHDALQTLLTQREHTRAAQAHEARSWLEGQHRLARDRVARACAAPSPECAGERAMAQGIAQRLAQENADTLPPPLEPAPRCDPAAP